MELLKISKADKSKKDHIVKSLANICTCYLEEIFLTVLSKHCTFYFHELESFTFISNLNINQAGVEDYSQILRMKYEGYSKNKN